MELLRRSTVIRDTVQTRMDGTWREKCFLECFRVNAATVVV